jgi:hypothetical protein
MAKTITENFSYAKGQVVEAGGCLAITFKRKTGTNAVSVNGYPLDEGESWSIIQNVGDEDWGKYQLRFTADVNANEIWVFKTMILND